MASEENLSEERKGTLFTVGKVDAGMAILLTKDHHVVEVPALLLPADVNAGSMVRVLFETDHEEENARLGKFFDLQTNIMSRYTKKPTNPTLNTTNIGHYTATVAWDAFETHECIVKGVDVFRDGSRIHSIQAPLAVVMQKFAVAGATGSGMKSATSDDAKQETLLDKNKHFWKTNNVVKLSGLEPERTYKVHMAMRTTGGRYTSPAIQFTTPPLSDLSGIHLAYAVETMPDTDVEALKTTAQELGIQTPDEEISMHCTHFVSDVNVGDKQEKAAMWQIPIVTKDWLLACRDAKQVVPAKDFSM